MTCREAFSHPVLQTFTDPNLARPPTGAVPGPCPAGRDRRGTSEVGGRDAKTSRGHLTWNAAGTGGWAPADLWTGSCLGIPVLEKITRLVLRLQLSINSTARWPTGPRPSPTPKIAAPAWSPRPQSPRCASLEGSIRFVGRNGEAFRFVQGP